MNNIKFTYENNFNYNMENYFKEYAKITNNKPLNIGLIINEDYLDDLDDIIDKKIKNFYNKNKNLESKK